MGRVCGGCVGAACVCASACACLRGPVCVRARVYLSGLCVHCHHTRHSPQWLSCRGPCLSHCDECCCVQSTNPYSDLEYYMNWERGSWNDRPYVVAQGEGVFKHLDAKKYGM